MGVICKTVQGPLSAKAVGEPPLALAASVHLALAAAARAAATQTFGIKAPAATLGPLAVPATPQVRHPHPCRQAGRQAGG
jgi:xanthine dehydrogenase molybdopterin-binding subunit B